MAELTADAGQYPSWPAGMRVIVRKERPHPGHSCGSPTATDCDRPHSPPTPPRGQLAALGCATVAGPAAKTASVPPRTAVCVLPLHGFDQNRIWCVIVELACEVAGLDPDARATR